MAVNLKINFNDYKTNPNKDSVSNADKLDSSRNFEKKQLQPVNSSKISFKGRLHVDDLNHLEGIQNGLESFKGLNIKQVITTLQNLTIIPLESFCNIGCLHCSEDAKPKQLDKLNSYLWDDYKVFMSDIKQLTKEIKKVPKFYYFFQEVLNKHMILFLKANPISMKILDSKGEPHGLTEAVDECYDAIGKPVEIVIAPWNKTDIWTQKQAKIFNKYARGNSYKLSQEKSHLSVNLFHPLMAKSIELEKTNPKASEKFRNIYIDRVVNALLTFFESGVVPQIRGSDDARNCSSKMQDELNNEIFNNFDEKLKQNGFKFWDASYKERTNYEITRARLTNLFEFDYSQSIVPYGRGKNLFAPEYGENSRKDLDSTYKETHTKYPKVFIEGLPFGAYGKLIAPNGAVYYKKSPFNYQPTGINLNFINKGKEIAPLNES